MTYPVARPSRPLLRLLEPAVTITSIFGMFVSFAVEQVALAAVPATVLVSQAAGRRTSQNQQALVELQQTQKNLVAQLEQIFTRIESLESTNTSFTDPAPKSITTQHLLPINKVIQDYQLKFRQQTYWQQNQDQINQTLQAELQTIQAKLQTQAQELKALSPALNPQKTVILMDAANLYHSARDLNWKIDYEKLITYLKRTYPQAQIYFFVAVKPENVKQQQFLASIEQQGCQLITRSLDYLPGGKLKGNLDVEIAMHMTQLSGQIGKIVLLSGDGDFIPAVEKARQQGTQVEVISFSKSTKRELRQAANIYKNLSTFVNLLIPRNPPSAG